jgi:hypothetical protein
MPSTWNVEDPPLVGWNISLKSRGYNPAWHFAKFSDLLSYGTAWGEGAETVITGMRQRKNTKDTFARVLLKPGDWPIPEE